MEPIYLLQQLLRDRDVAAILASSKPKVWADVAVGLLPPPVKTGLRAARWVQAEIAAVQRARIAGIDESGIIALVAELEASRVPNRSAAEVKQLVAKIVAMRKAKMAERDAVREEKAAKHQESLGARAKSRKAKSKAKPPTTDAPPAAT